MGMKQILVMMAVVLFVGCSKDTLEISQVAEPEPDPVPSAEEKIISISDPIVERAVRKKLEKPTGELNGADFEKVTDLKLDGTQITNEGLKEVAKLQNLTVLSLSYTKITDEGLKELAKLQELEKFKLSGTQVTKAGVAELQKALPNCNITGP